MHKEVANVHGNYYRTFENYAWYFTLINIRTEFWKTIIDKTHYYLPLTLGIDIYFDTL